MAAKSKMKDMRKLLANADNWGSTRGGPPKSKSQSQERASPKRDARRIMSDFVPPPGLGYQAEVRSYKAQKGLFPLPELHVDPIGGKLSRRGCQRRGRRIRLQVDTNEAIRSLNWLAGFCLDRGAFSPSGLQTEALEHVKAVEVLEGCTSPVPPEAAFRELRGSSVYEAAVHPWRPSDLSASVYPIQFGVALRSLTFFLGLTPFSTWRTLSEC